MIVSQIFRQHPVVLVDDVGCSSQTLCACKCKIPYHSDKIDGFVNEENPKSSC